MTEVGTYVSRSLFFVYSSNANFNLLSWAVPKFYELYLPQKDTKEKIQQFMRLSIEYKSIGIVVDFPYKGLSTFVAFKDSKSINMSIGILLFLLEFDDLHMG